MHCRNGLKMENKNTLTLIDEWIDNDLNMQMAESDNEKEMYIEKMKELKAAIRTKQLNIKDVLLKRKTDEALIGAEMQVHKDFIAKLQRRKKATQRIYEFLSDLVITTVETVGVRKGKGKFSYENNGHRFTVFQTDGSLDINDPDSVPERFLKMEVKIDNAELRKFVKQNDGDVGYATVPKVKRLKIT